MKELIPIDNQIARGKTFLGIHLKTPIRYTSIMAGEKELYRIVVNDGFNFRNIGYKELLPKELHGWFNLVITGGDFKDVLFYRLDGNYYFFNKNRGPFCEITKQGAIVALHSRYKLKFRQMEFISKKKWSNISFDEIGISAEYLDKIIYTGDNDIERLAVCLYAELYWDEVFDQPYFG
ncbi:hypothetical protein ACFL1N_14295 [Thermodesulfobacteriota bacterium]